MSRQWTLAARTRSATSCPSYPACARRPASASPQSGLELVVGIGAQLWLRLFDAEPHAEFHPFIPLDGDRHSAPSTPSELLFHLRANSLDACYSLAAQIIGKLRGSATVIDEVHGFGYFDRRDLLALPAWQLRHRAEVLA